MADQFLETMGARKGIDPFLDLTADNTVAAIKAAPGKLYFLQCTNPNPYDVWIQLFDALTAGVTLGTTVPTLSFCVPGGGGVGHETVWAPVELPVSPIKFAVGISYAVTADKDGNTAPTADVVINALHKF